MVRYRWGCQSLV